MTGDTREELFKLIEKRIADIKERMEKSSLGKDKTTCGGHYGIGSVWIGFKEPKLGNISFQIHKEKGHDKYQENMVEADFVHHAKDDLEFLLGILELFDIRQDAVYNHINSNYSKV